MRARLARNSGVELLSSASRSYTARLTRALVCGFRGQCLLQNDQVGRPTHARLDTSGHFNRK